MLPLPTHLKDTLIVDESKFDGHSLDGAIRCACGCEEIRLRFYGEDRGDFLRVKKYQDDYGLRISGVCSRCGKSHELFDMAKHGYNGFVCGDGRPVADSDLEGYRCHGCGGSGFSVEMGIELEDLEQFIEEVVDYEPEKYRPEDYVDAFDWVTISLKCKGCGKSLENWVNFETS